MPRIRLANFQASGTPNATANFGQAVASFQAGAALDEAARKYERNASTRGAAKWYANVISDRAFANLVKGLADLTGVDPDVIRKNSPVALAWRLFQEEVKKNPELYVGKYRESVKTAGGKWKDNWLIAVLGPAAPGLPADVRKSYEEAVKGLKEELRKYGVIVE